MTVFLGIGTVYCEPVIILLLSKKDESLCTECRHAGRTGIQSGSLCRNTDAQALNGTQSGSVQRKGNAYEEIRFKTKQPVWP